MLNLFENKNSLHAHRYGEGGEIKEKNSMSTEQTTENQAYLFCFTTHFEQFAIIM